MTLYLLLQDPAHVGVRGVSSEGKHRSWERVCQWDSGNQGCLGCLEGSGQGR
jgi:hypothetical protein